MKKLYFLLITLMIGVAAWSQTTYTWIGANNTPWTTSTNWSPNRTAPAATDILQFNAGNTRSITNFPTAETVGRILITNNTSITINSVGGIQTLTIGNGVADAVDDLFIENGSTLIQANTFNEVRLAANARANIAGAYTIQAAEGFYLNNAGVVATVTGSLTNAGAVNNATAAKLIFTGGTYFHSLNGGTVPTATWNTGSVLDLSGMTTAYPGGMGQTFRSVVFSGNITADVEIGANLNCLEDLTISLNPGLGDDLRLTNDNTNRTVTVGRNFNMVSGTLSLDNDNGGSSLNIAGNFSQSGGVLTETSSGSATINFNGTTEQTVTKSAGTLSNALNFVVLNNAIVNFGTSVLDGTNSTFNLNSGGKIITSSNDGLRSTGALGSIQVGGTRTYSSGAIYEFRGNNTGIFTTTTNPQVEDIIINNTSGNVTLNQPMTVNGTLTLTSGLLNSDATNLLTLPDGATTTGASNTSFVNGPIRKSGNDLFTFPVGKSGVGYQPIAISAAGGSNTFIAEYIRAIPVNKNSITAIGVQRISNCEYWNLNRSTGTSSVTVTLNWNANSPCNAGQYVTEPSTMRVVRYNTGSSSWDAVSTTNGTGTATTGAAAWTGVNTFGSFALGTTSITQNPLPVMFADVKAYAKNSGVQIEWSNLTERDIVKYQVERSANGQTFTVLSEQLPKSNRDDKASYTSFDGTPLQGANFYRIKVYETNGKIIYSKILKVDMGAAKQGLMVYPNPVIGNQLTVALNGIRQGKYNLVVYNSNGQNVFQRTLNNAGNSMTETIDLPASVKPGVYNMVITDGDYRGTKTFIVK